jgi:hypothetical protein
MVTALSPTRTAPRGAVRIDTLLRCRARGTVAALCLLLCASNAVADGPDPNANSARKVAAPTATRGAKRASGTFHFQATLRPSPVSELLAPAAFRAPLAEGPHERTLRAELRAGDPKTLTVVRLVIEPDANGWVRNARIEVTPVARAASDGRTRAPQVVTLGPLLADRALVMSSFELLDVDFDGFLDVRVLRDFGAKWARHAYRAFDPRTGMFVDTDVSRQLEHFANVTVLNEEKRIESESLGPAAPSWTRYLVAGRRLQAERSCTFVPSEGMPGGTLVVRSPNAPRGRETRSDLATRPGNLAELCRARP